MARASPHQRMIDEPRRLDKYGPMLLTGVAAMETGVTRRLGAGRAINVLVRRKMLSWYQSDTPG
jgi:hypothetical protein